MRLEHEGWRPIKSDVQNTDINHAIYFASKYYATDEHNRLVIKITKTTMHVVRPTGVLRKSEGNNNAVVAFTNEENPEFVTVQAPTQNKTLLQVIHFNNAFYAIDKYNTLVIASERILRQINGRRILSMAAMGDNSLFFVLADKVLVTEPTDRFGDLKELITDHYDGEVSKIITGDSHAIFETKNGHYASGSNTSHEFGMKGDSTARPVRVPTLDILPIERIYCGGWHCYAKLRDGTFVGWGYNKVCINSIN